MLNIEKYADKIKEQIANGGEGIACAVQNLKNNGSYSCQLCTACEVDALNWLSQEYKEPILTEDDKTFLKSLIGSYKEYAVSIEIVYTLRPDYTSGSPDYTSGLDKNLAIRSAKIKLTLPHKLENETLTWYITWPILNDSLLKNLKVGPVYTINELELYK